MHFTLDAAQGSGNHMHVGQVFSLLEVGEVNSILANHILPPTILMYSSPCIERWVSQNVLNLAIRGPVDVILLCHFVVECNFADKRLWLTGYR